MSRLSSDEFDATGRLINGYDYENQSWVLNGRYVRCGHPDPIPYEKAGPRRAFSFCQCYGRIHEGEETR